MKTSKYFKKIPNAHEKCKQACIEARRLVLTFIGIKSYRRKIRTNKVI